MKPVGINRSPSGPAVLGTVMLLLNAWVSIHVTPISVVFSYLLFLNYVLGTITIATPADRFSLVLDNVYVFMYAVVFFVYLMVNSRPAYFSAYPRFLQENVLPVYAVICYIACVLTIIFNAWIADVSKSGSTGSGVDDGGLLDDDLANVPER